jgi:hypothetical protein
MSPHNLAMLCPNQGFGECSGVLLLLLSARPPRFNMVSSFVSVCAACCSVLRTSSMVVPFARTSFSTFCLDVPCSCLWAKCPLNSALYFTLLWNPLHFSSLNIGVPAFFLDCNPVRVELPCISHHCPPSPRTWYLLSQQSQDEWMSQWRNEWIDASYQLLAKRPSKRNFISLRFCFPICHSKAKNVQCLKRISGSGKISQSDEQGWHIELRTCYIQLSLLCFRVKSPFFTLHVSH